MKKLPAGWLTPHHVDAAAAVEIHPLDAGAGFELAEAVEEVGAGGAAPLHAADADAAAAQGGAVDPGAEAAGRHLGGGGAGTGEQQGQGGQGRAAEHRQLLQQALVVPILGNLAVSGCRDGHVSQAGTGMPESVRKWPTRSRRSRRSPCQLSRRPAGAAGSAVRGSSQRQKRSLSR